MKVVSVIGTIATGVIIYLLVGLTYIGFACLYDDGKIDFANAIMVIMSLLITALILYLLVGKGLL
jgi:hypothetical protein